MSVGTGSEVVLQIPKERSTDWLARAAGHAFRLAECESYFWLRVAEADLAAVAILSQLPGKQFRLTNVNLLTEKGKTVASASLPELAWKPLEQWLELKLPAAAFPAQVELVAPEVIRLQRTALDASPSAGLYEIEALQNWGVRISQQRLKCLQYAYLPNFEGASRILLVGSPLPNLSGRFLWKHGPVYLPVGLSWNPPVPADTIAKVFDLCEDEFLLWTERDRSVVIPADSLQPLSRTELRLFGSGGPQAEEADLS